MYSNTRLYIFGLICMILLVLPNKGESEILYSKEKEIHSTAIKYDEQQREKAAPPAERGKSKKRKKRKLRKAKLKQDKVENLHKFGVIFSSVAIGLFYLGGTAAFFGLFSGVLAIFFFIALGLTFILGVTATVFSFILLKKELPYKKRKVLAALLIILGSSILVPLIIIIAFAGVAAASFLIPFILLALAAIAMLVSGILNAKKGQQDKKAERK